MKHITVLIPCYNEAEAIGVVVEKFKHVGSTLTNFVIEVLVIDNNSKDDTTAVATAAGARVVFEGKQGKGNAVRTGFHSISQQTDYVIMLDGDDTYNAYEVMRLVELLDSGFADVVIGSRMGGKIREGAMKGFNRLGNWGFSFAVRGYYKVNVTDTLTGYFGWKREVVEKLRQHVESDGFAIEMEMITKMARLGYQIYSVPISYDPRLGESSLRPIRDGARILSMYVRGMFWQPQDESGLDERQFTAQHFKPLIPQGVNGEQVYYESGHENSISI